MLILALDNYIFVQVKKKYILNITMDEVITDDVIIKDKVTRINNYKEGLVYFKKYDDVIRRKRNELLKRTDYLMLNDVNIDLEYLNKVKKYRQELRDFMNKLSNDEIQCNILLDIDEFADVYFPKLELLILLT